MKIDTHIHIFSTQAAADRQGYLDDHGFRLLYAKEKAGLATADDACDYAVSNGLDAFWCMGFCWESAERCIRENSRIAEESAGNERFTLFAGVPSLPFPDIKKLIRDAKGDGFRGIGEVAFYGSGLDIKNEQYCRSIFEAACEEDMPVCLHVTEPVGHSYPGKHATDFSVIYDLIRDFPSLRIMLSHMGGGLLFYEQMPEVREAFRNVVYDTAAAPFLYDRDIYRRVVELAGNEKILFGSDYPLLGIKRYEDAIMKALSPEIAQGVMGENAMKFISARKV